MYIFSVISKSIALLTKSERVKLTILILFFIFSAIIQVLGVASIAPFMALLTSPEIIHTNKLFGTVYNYFHFTETKKFTETVAIFSLLMMVLSNAMSILTLWLSMRFSIVIGNSIQCRLYENLMFRPYLYHKNVNHSSSISTIRMQAPRFVYMVLQPFLLLLSNVFVGLVMLVGLIFLNPFVSFLTGTIIGGAYFLTYLFVKKLLNKHGHNVSVQNINVQKLLTEGFAGIKDVMLNRSHENFFEKFNSFNLKGLHSQSILTMVGDIPKFAIETVAFSVIFIAAIIALRMSNNSESIVALLSVYAIAGYRLLPTLQQIYKSISSMSGNGSVVSELSQHLSTIITSKDNKNLKPYEIVDQITLENITFKYPSAADTTLKNVNVTFSLKMINTIAGPSGSGKTTLVDILLGLIPPDSGSMYINGKTSDADSIIRLQQSCGYVPQHIFILDDTVIANVAFGIDRNKIDEKRIIAVLKKASAWDFVCKLPEGITTKLGQDGKLLSGGQRQRIGIARSLYKDPKILVLDEPTSALDIESEYDFMMLLRTLKDQMLIIIISHRPSAIKCSDLITLVENGKIEAHGSLNHLQETSPIFRNMLEKSNFNEVTKPDVISKEPL